MMQHEPALSLDRLTAKWSLYQLKKGHRFSTDDLAVAWRAALSKPDAVHLLDLGCGIGSVGLSTLWLLEQGGATCSLTGVEAQAVSARLARKSVEYNGLADRVNIHTGDIRHQSCLPSGQRFDLITGSPPYFAVGTALISPNPQKAGARMELRGTVADYCAAAKRWLAPKGRFSYVMPTGDERAHSAPVANGLQIIERFDLTFAKGRDPYLSVFTCVHEGEPQPLTIGHMAVRGEDGEWTPEYLAFRALWGPYGSK